jgi:hypothetical protein
MKKVLSVFAVLVMSIGLFSCEAETNLEDTQALYDNLDDSTRADGESSGGDGRD